MIIAEYPPHVGQQFRERGGGPGGVARLASPVGQVLPSGKSVGGIRAEVMVSHGGYMGE
ncbi:hypothetical protein WBG99_24765 [Streptomyces sp. TG1A-60]|uniref:hypothetical protein n=1 Tax=Streptomyces sp. TG1A-60 TaxID=3129111 RepID=UPI0030D4218B